MKKLLIILMIMVTLISGCVQEKPNDFIFPEDSITLQGPIIPVRLEGCNQYVLSGGNLIEINDCESVENVAPCIRIPLSLLDYYKDVYEKTGKYEYFSDKLTCDGEALKPYCQVKMDNEIIIKEGCFDTGLKAITTYSEKPTDLTKTHTFTICCSATDSEKKFDVCKSFTMERIC